MSMMSEVGEVAEWLKAHAWKACIRVYRIAGSNPVFSDFFIIKIYLSIELKSL